VVCVAFVVAAPVVEGVLALLLSLPPQPASGKALSAAATTIAGTVLMSGRRYAGPGAAPSSHRHEIGTAAGAADIHAMTSCTPLTRSTVNV
jgi:hypothetical protein